MRYSLPVTIWAFLALLLVGLAAVFQAAFLLRRENPRDPASPWMLLAASLLLLETLVQRGIRIRSAAATGMYDSLVLFSAAICALLFVLRRARRTRDLPPLVMFGVTLVSLALLVISRSPLVSRGVQASGPALHSPWLALHIVITLIGESFFVVGFIAGVGFLISRRDESRAALDRLAGSSIAIGYPLFTVGALLLGAAWAKTAFGRWWTGDAKEITALATWLVYTLWVFSRIVKRLRGTVSAVLALIGFLAALFTFFGVNYLLPSLHTYR